ncbi:hypothetical protein [Nonomuraea sp. NPDC049709]|uniref:hypothetical protein n=1 Tax=Nonomuraea sp. NPDC049709 TaxID=3154736 RepID=UPI0034158A01
MRVATLNLWTRHGSWSERREVLITGLRDLCPDLVAFQESVVADDHDQVVDLLGPDYHVVHQEADGAIACHSDTYRVNRRRPITAIREAGTDGNPATVPDPAWKPLIETPPTPEHPSGHTCVSGAAVPHGSGGQSGRVEGRPRSGVIAG